MGDITDNNVEHCYVRVRNGTAALDEVCDQLSHLTNESLQTLLMIEDAYGDPLITLLLRNYGFDACIAVYDTIAANRIVLECSDIPSQQVARLIRSIGAFACLVSTRRSK